LKFGSVIGAGAVSTGGGALSEETPCKFLRIVGEYVDTDLLVFEGDEGGEGAAGVKQGGAEGSDDLGVGGLKAGGGGEGKGLDEG